MSRDIEGYGYPCLGISRSTDIKVTRLSVVLSVFQRSVGSRLLRASADSDHHALPVHCQDRFSPVPKKPIKTRYFWPFWEK